MIQKKERENATKMNNLIKSIVLFFAFLCALRVKINLQLTANANKMPTTKKEHILEIRQTVTTALKRYQVVNPFSHKPR